MRTTTINARQRQRLRDRLGGAVLGPDDHGYQQSRAIWNDRLGARPGAIARCTDTADVAAAVDLARSDGLQVAVRSGGHDYAGYSTCDGALVIDLSAMAGIRVDTSTARATIGPGARWREIDEATQRHGLATTGCTVSTVGAAGFVLGGGTGHLARRHGLALDNLVAAEVVLASGKRVRASESENPDLFWALRGGGGNFGVVTSFELALHELGPDVLGGQVIHRLADAGDVLRRYRELMARAPDELQCYAFLFRLPPAAPLPRSLHGEVVLSLVAFHSGSDGNGGETLRELLGIGSPVLDDVRRRPYCELQRAFDAGVPEGLRWCSRGHYLDGIADGAIDSLLVHSAEMTGPMTMVYFEPLGGAVSRVGPTETAYAHRDAGYTFHALAGWEKPAQDSEVIAWTRGLHDAMARHATGAAYLNHLSSCEQERVRAVYGVNYERLARLKRRYDPDNLFCRNHNVEPASVDDAPRDT